MLYNTQMAGHQVRLRQGIVERETMSLCGLNINVVLILLQGELASAGNICFEVALSPIRLQPRGIWLSLLYLCVNISVFILLIRQARLVNVHFKMLTKNYQISITNSCLH